MNGEEDGVLYELPHHKILGRTTRAEDERSRKAVQAARDAGDIDAGGGSDVQRRAECDTEGQTQIRAKRTEVPAAGAAGAGRGTPLAASAADASDVVDALAAFEGMTRLEMARHLVAAETRGRAALLRKFLVAKGGA